MSKLQLLTACMVFVISLILRLHNYAVYPQRGATSDEYSYSFQGVSLLTKGKPISWSAFPAYGKPKDLAVRGIYFPIVEPYFDHTPLNGILVGGWALLFGQNDFAKIDLGTIRLVPIFLSTLSSIFLFLIALRLWNYKTALWALLIYTTTTIFVMNGRVVLAENLVTPLMLGSIYLLMRWKNSMSTTKSIMLGSLSALAFLTKELGIAIFVIIAILLVIDKVKRKYLASFAGTFLFFVLAYLGYGAYYDWNLFLRIVGGQAGRDVGPDTLLYITSTPIIINKIYYDGWYFFGFISLFAAFTDYKKNKEIVIAGLVYLIFLLSFLTQRGEMGWYIIPLFPLMALTSARLLVRSLEENGWYIFVFLAFIGMYVITYAFKTNFGLTAFQYRTLLLLFFAPSIMTVALGKQILFKRIGSFWFYVFILVNIYLTYTYVHPV